MVTEPPFPPWRFVPSPALIATAPPSSFTPWAFPASTETRSDEDTENPLPSRVSENGTPLSPGPEAEMRPPPKVLSASMTRFPTILLSAVACGMRVARGRCRARGRLVSARRAVRRAPTDAGAARARSTYR